MIGQCRKVVGILQGLMAFFAIAITITQIMLAIRVSAYARMLRHEEDRFQEERLSEVELLAGKEDSKETEEKSDTLWTV